MFRIQIRYGGARALSQPISDRFLKVGAKKHREDPPHFTLHFDNLSVHIIDYKLISGETEANRKPNENPYWHDFLRSVVDFDSKIKEKFNGRKSFSISIYGSLKYLTNQGGFTL